MSKTPFIKKHRKKERKVKQVRRHYKKVLRMLAQDLREIEEVLR